MASRTDFPILDFSKYKKDHDSFAKELFKASNKWGFFVLTSHGIRGVDHMFDLSREFFDLPLEQKSEKTMDEHAIGYDGKAKTTFAASEGFSFGTTPGGIFKSKSLPTWWNHSRQQEVEAFKADCYELSIAIMSCFAGELGLPKDYFVKAHQHRDPGNTLKLIKYPKMERHEGQPVPRLSEHTDWGSITFVFTKQGGLEIRDLVNEWCHVPVVADAVVVNIGDALSLWTGKALKSTMHRITWENLPMDKDRYSIAYFTNPNYDARLARPDQEPSQALTYQDYYNVRLRLTYGSLTDVKSGKKMFMDVDPAAFEAVRSLNVANSGVLETHERAEQGVVI